MGDTSHILPATKLPLVIADTADLLCNVRRTTMAQRAFTLLELLVTLTLIGVLTAIALPQYPHYRQKVFDFRAQSDLRSAALAEESYFLDNEEYLSCENEGCLAMSGLSRISRGVRIRMSALDAGFVGEASHPRGSGKIFRWDSENGGFAE